MSEDELNQKLDEIRAGMKWHERNIHLDFVDGELKHYITDEQIDNIQKILDLFQALNWQVKLNAYRTLLVEESLPVNKAQCGTPVKIRSCKKEHGDKTYFGILIGDIPRTISHRIDSEGNLIASLSLYNPAIFVPELNDIVFGMEAWWTPIDDEKELDGMITDEAVQNIWYVKILNRMTANKEEEN